MNPFPGLRPFREDEEYLFFGRETQVDTMVDKLGEHHFLAVVGTSGSGKSSLVNCGLRPALYRGLLAAAGTQWRVARFRPGGNPIRALAQALAKEGVLYNSPPPGPFNPADVIETTLRTSKLGLLDARAHARLGGDVNLLIVADQFEELFRFRTAKATWSEEAIALVNLLLEAREQPQARIYVTLTMRSDFLGECAQALGLPEAINKGLYLVPRMTRDEQKAAIVGPAAVGGAEIDPVLLTSLLNDAGGNPDQLPILQHALHRTWVRWQGDAKGLGALEPRHYQAIGAMGRALNLDAEEAYGQFENDLRRVICERIFKALTDRGKDARGVRRPTRLGALCDLSGGTEDEVREIIDVFRNRAFLMPPAGEAIDEETIIDLSHESLMRLWDRLKTWGDEEAESAQIYLRLAETARLYQAGRASLWHDPDLTVAWDWFERQLPTKVWADQYRPGFESAIQFLRQSKDVFDRARAAEQAIAERIQRRARLVSRWKYIGGVVLPLAVIAFATTFGVKTWLQKKADLVVVQRFVALVRAGQRPNPCTFADALVQEVTRRLGKLPMASCNPPLATEEAKSLVTRYHDLAGVYDGLEPVFLGLRSRYRAEVAELEDLAGSVGDRKLRAQMADVLMAIEAIDLWIGKLASDWKKLSMATHDFAQEIDRVFNLGDVRRCYLLDGGIRASGPDSIRSECAKRYKRAVHDVSSLLADLPQPSEAEKRKLFSQARAAANEKRFKEALALMELAAEEAPDAFREEMAREAAAQNAWERLNSALSKQDDDSAMIAIGECASERLYWCGKVEAVAKEVKAAFVRKQLQAAKQARTSKQSIRCREYVQKGLIVDPANAEAQRLLADPDCSTALPPLPDNASQKERDDAAAKLVGQGNERYVGTNYDAAIESFLQALALKPKGQILGLAYRGLGTVYTWKGDKRNVVKYFKLYLPYAAASEKAKVSKIINYYSRPD